MSRKEPSNPAAAPHGESPAGGEDVHQLNAASARELTQLPRIGADKARRIVRYCEDILPKARGEAVTRERLYLETYERIFADGTTTVLLRPDSDLVRYLESPRPRR